MQEINNIEYKNEDKILNVENLSVNFKTFDGMVRALDHVNLELKSGEVLGIIGESGSGKSTTALALLGLLADNAQMEGRINYLDKEVFDSGKAETDPKKMKKYKKSLDQRLIEIRWKEISMIFQGAMNAFNPVHTIRRQLLEVFEVHNEFSDISLYNDDDYINKRLIGIKAGEKTENSIDTSNREEFQRLKDINFENMVNDQKLALQKMSYKEKRKLLMENAIEDACIKAGFNIKFLDSYPHELSGGMRQRGIIAMALALNPKIILADEPTTGLDVITQAKIIKELKGLRESGQIKSMVVITHDVGVVAQLADNVAVMYAGRIMEYGRTKDVFLHPLNPYTYSLLRSYPSIHSAKEKIYGIPGSVPDLLNPPKGCYFASRCFMAEDICFKETPQNKIMQDGIHTSLCHFTSPNEEKYAENNNNQDYSHIENQLTGIPRIEAKEISKYFGLRSSLSTKLYGGSEKQVVHAVDQVSLQVEKGTIIGIVGESGSGKTTFGRLLVNAIEPTSGELLYSAMDQDEPFDIAKLGKMSRRYHIFRKDAQLIFQDPFDSIDPKMTIFSTVAEPLLIQLKNNEEFQIEHFNLKKEVTRALNLAHLTPAENYFERYPHQLSGGERQRVSMARAITLNPKLLVADEPISMLDVSIRANVMNILIDMKETNDVSIVYISHDIASARYVSDYIAVMYLGQIVEFGRAELVIKDPLHPYTRALISAVPSLDPNWSNSEIKIVGEIGSAINPKKACRFYSRCIYHKDICKTEEPSIINEGERYYLCHFNQDLLSINQDMITKGRAEEGSN